MWVIIGGEHTAGSQSRIKLVTPSPHAQTFIIVNLRTPAQVPWLPYSEEVSTYVMAPIVLQVMDELVTRAL